MKYHCGGCDKFFECDDMPKACPHCAMPCTLIAGLYIPAVEVSNPTWIEFGLTSTPLPDTPLLLDEASK